jgi:serine protease Do
MCGALIRAFAVFVAVHFISVPAFARSIEPGEAAVAQLALSAVVNISTWKVRPAQKAGERPRRVKTYASGFIIDPSGIIVTNKHVIDGAIDIKVTLNSGDAVPGKLLAVAVMLDLAVVKVEVDQPLPALNWGNSENLRVGDSVLTIGNPLGLGMSVSVGIVSALNRDLQDTPFDSYIQTDAALNHGNSGGPLIDRDGAVVGIDTYLYNPEKAGGFIGIGFAIPADAAKFVVSRLLDPNKPEPGWLGVTLQDLTPELSDALRVHGAKGAIIAVVQPGGPASKAELRPGDVLSAIGAARQTDARAFMRAIVRTPVGQVVELTFWRGGKEQTVSATLRHGRT